MTGRSRFLSQDIEDHLIAHASPPGEVLTETLMTLLARRRAQA